MELLEHYDFSSRPSTSRYAEVADVLLDDNRVNAVRLHRGEDFDKGVVVTSVQASIRSLLSKRGRRARTRVVNDDVIVVGLYDENDKPRAARRRQKAAAPPY